MKPTPGPWIAEHRNEDGKLMLGEDASEVSGPTYHSIEAGFNQGLEPVADTMNRHHCIDQDEDRANAMLIAEAGTVYSETGMTPRQLKSDRDRLAGELAELKAKYEDCHASHQYDAEQIDDLKQQLAAKTSECDKQAVELAALREKAGKVVSTKQWYMQVRHAEQPMDNDAVNKAGEDFEYALVSLAAHLSTGKANDQSGLTAESEK